MRNQYHFSIIVYILDVGQLTPGQQKFLIFFPYEYKTRFAQDHFLVVQRKKAIGRDLVSIVCSSLGQPKVFQLRSNQKG